MKLKEYLIQHIGRTARIGCENGSGFIFAGRIGLYLPNQIMRKAERKVISVSASSYGGEIVLIEGSESGSEWLPPELELRPEAEIPDSLYLEFADFIAASVVKELWNAMISATMGAYRKRREEAWNRVDFYRSIVLSPTFSALTPKANPDEILTLLEQRFLKEYGEKFRDPREFGEEV